MDYTILYVTLPPTIPPDVLIINASPATVLNDDSAETDTLPFAERPIQPVRLVPVFDKNLKVLAPVEETM